MFITIIGMSDEKRNDPVLSQVKNYIDSEGLTKTEFCNRINVIPQSFTNWQNRGVPSYKLQEIARELKITIDELVTGKKPASKLPVYTVSNAPKCKENEEYILFAEGGVVPNYPDPGKFLCIPFDDDARNRGTYVLWKKDEDSPPSLCVLIGPKYARTGLAELVDGQRVNHPDYLHPISPEKILCAIFDVINDTGLWSDQ